MTGQRPAWGAWPEVDGRWSLRLWAPGHDAVTAVVDGAETAMTATGDGWFEATVPGEAGSEYLFVLPDGLRAPDPASRRQRHDVHGPSLLTRPVEGPTWAGRPWEEAVIQEIHVGTFTAEGTYRAAIAHLKDMADIGFTAVELMPLAQFAGDRGWGYDGVLAYAPHPIYGTPDDLRAFVAAAHDVGLMVFIDVVMNHFGPEGAYLHPIAPEFFDEERHTPWGAAIDFTQPPVRRFFIENAIYWIREFGFDGIRFDAIDSINDPSDPDLMVEIAREIRATFPDRQIHLATEDERNITYLHERGEDGSVPLHTAEWNDDFHNAAHVVASGEHEGYYKPYKDNPVGLMARTLAEGFSHQGENGRGVDSTGQPPTAFVDFLQNHDQIGNRAFGERLQALTDHDTLEALTAILLLSPHIPLMFMGEEYGETRPFTFFAGFEGDLAKAVRDGRRAEFAHFQDFDTDPEQLPDPIARSSVEASRIDRSRRETPEGRAALERTRHLLALRQMHVVPYLAGTGGKSGRVLECRDRALAIDWRLNGALLQLRANFGSGEVDLPGAEGDEIHSTAHPGHTHWARHWILTE